MSLEPQTTATIRAIDEKRQNPHTGDRIIFKPTKWQKDLIEKFKNMKPGKYFEKRRSSKIKVPR